MTEYAIMFAEPTSPDDVQFCDEKRVIQYIEYFKAKGKNKNILVLKVQERLVANVDVKYAHYVYNDKGEVLPK